MAMATCGKGVPVIKAVLKGANVGQNGEINLRAAIAKVKSLHGCDIRQFDNDQSIQALVSGIDVPVKSYYRAENLGDVTSEGTFERIGTFKFESAKYMPSPQELKKAPASFPDSRHRIVDQNTPLCTNYKALKGPNNDLLMLVSQRGSGRKKSLHRCKWFSFNYWHTNSFQGSILKSKPGILVTCHNNFVFNCASNISGEIPMQIQNTAFPFKSAVYRTRVKKLMRKQFLDIYLRNEEFANTFYGLYKFTVLLYPRTDEEIEDVTKNIEICLRKVAQMDMNAAKREADQELQRLPWFEVNRILEKNNVQNFPLRKPKSTYKGTRGGLK